MTSANWVLLFALAASLLGGGCASSTVLAPPAKAFSTICDLLEDRDANQSAYMAKSTAPLYDTFAIRVLREANSINLSNIREDTERDERLRQEFRSRKISNEAFSSCRRLTPLDKESFSRDTGDILKLEVSNMAEFDFGERGELGFFLRASFNGVDGAIWFWIAKSRTGRWEAFNLEISDG